MDSDNCGLSPTANGECIRTIHGHSQSVHSQSVCALAVHKDTIISGSADGEIKLWTLDLRNYTAKKILKGHSALCNGYKWIFL